MKDNSSKLFQDKYSERIKQIKQIRTMQKNIHGYTFTFGWFFTSFDKLFAGNRDWALGSISNQFWGFPNV